MAVHIGFTGTQAGMLRIQADKVGHLLEIQPAHVRILDHGMCKGADEQTDGMARRAGYAIHIRPSTVINKQARCPVRAGYDMLFPAKPPLDRNRDIVDACEVLIAAPKEMSETLRSGTWATIRYCRKVGKPLFIVWPDGSVTEERTL